MSYNRDFFRNLDLGKFTKTNPYKDDIIVDPEGQYNHPGQNTRVPLGDNKTITTEGIPYPMFVQPQVGPPVITEPNQTYTFPESEYVDEEPMLKKGGWLKKYQTEGQVIPAEEPTGPTEEEIFQATMDWMNTHPYQDMPKWKKLEQVSGSEAPRWKGNQIYIPYAGVNAYAPEENPDKNKYYYDTVPMEEGDIRLNVGMINNKPFVIAPQQGDMSNQDYRELVKRYDRFNEQYLNTYRKPGLTKNAPAEVFHVYGQGMPYREDLQSKWYMTYPSMAPVQQKTGGSTPCYKCGAEVYHRVMQDGGEYADVELSIEDIQALRNAGYRVEDI